VSLVGILAAVLFLELWLNRIVARMLLHDPSGPLMAFHRFDAVAVFSFELAAVLAEVVLVGAIFKIASSATYRPAFRVSVGTIGTITVALLLYRGHALRPHLYLSAFFLLVVIVLGAQTLPTPRRLRAGIAFLAVPMWLILAANLLQRLTAQGVLDPRASALVDCAGVALVVVGLLSPWLLAPDGPAGPVATAAAALAVGGGLALGWVDWELESHLATLGVGVTMPWGRATLPFYVLGAGLLVFTTFALVGRPGPERLRGVGLFLVGAVGLQLELPYQIAGSLVGFFCLLESGNRPAFDAISRAELDELLRRLAGQVGAGQVTVVGAEGHERARLGFAVPADTAQPIAGVLAVDRRAGAVARF
jgi:hypothetical protein